MSSLIFSVDPSFGKRPPTRFYAISSSSSAFLVLCFVMAGLHSRANVFPTLLGEYKSAQRLSAGLITQGLLAVVAADILPLGKRAEGTSSLKFVSPDECVYIFLFYCVFFHDRHRTNITAHVFTYFRGSKVFRCGVELRTYTSVFAKVHTPHTLRPRVLAEGPCGAM